MLLIIDDDSDLCVSLAKRLERRGYPIAFSGPAEEALDYLSSGKPTPDTLLVDFSLRNPYNEEQALWQMLCDRSHSVVVMTGFGEAFPEAETVRKYPGVMALLGKPVSMEALAAILPNPTNAA